MVEEPLPSIRLDFLDKETLQQILNDRGQELPDDLLYENDEVVKTKADSNHFEEDVDLMTSSNSDTIMTELHEESCHITATYTGDSVEPQPSQGLSYGRFAGLSPQDVAELMKQSIQALPEDDTQAKVKAMSPYIEYFGDLSTREMERVDGPPKPRTKGKRKRELAIRFPEQSTTERSLQDHVSD